MFSNRPVAEITFDFTGITSYNKLNSIGNLIIDTLKIE